MDNFFNFDEYNIIENSTTNKTVVGTESDDSISNSGNVVNIFGGNGKDTINNTGNLVTITGGNGDNEIYNSGKNVNINVGNGRNNITNASGADSVSIVLGDGVSYVNNAGDAVTITGGKTGVHVTNSGSAVMHLGDGNDVVSNFDKSSKAWVKINSGKGKDRISHSKSGITADLGDEDDIFTGVEVLGGSAISGGAGNDSIEIATDYAVKTALCVLDGGEGNDTLKSNAYRSMVIGGTGDDQVYLESSSDSKSHSHSVLYTYGDGNDTIQGFDSNDTLSITLAENDYTTLLSDNNIYFMFNEGSIALLNVGAGVGKSNFVIIQNEPATTTTQQPATTTTQQPTNTTPVASNTNVTNTVATNTNDATNNFFGFPLASNMFGFFGGQNNTIQNFKTGRGFNANVLAFGTSLTSINRTSSAMYFNAADGTKLQVNNSSSVNEAIQYTTDGTNISYAKVGYAEKNNSFTYEDGVNFYSGGSHTDVLQVTNYQSRNIWLDGSAGVGYSGINNIDASTSTGNNTLAGDGGNNQITAGSGNDSLWGGSGSSEDVLIGGSGQNMFWYGKGDGNDQVQKSKTGDVINLYDVTLSDIVSANFTGSAISVTFNTGFNLNVNVSSNLSSTFRLADGTNWQYNKSAGSWQSA